MATHTAALGVLTDSDPAPLIGCGWRLTAWPQAHANTSQLRVGGPAAARQGTITTATVVIDDVPAVTTAVYEFAVVAGERVIAAWQYTAGTGPAVNVAARAAVYQPPSATPTPTPTPGSGGDSTLTVLSALEALETALGDADSFPVLDEGAWKLSSVSRMLARVGTRWPRIGTFTAAMETKLAAISWPPTWASITGKPDRVGAFTSADESLLDAVGSILLAESVTRTFVDALTGSTDGEAILTDPTGEPSPIDKELAVEIDTDSEVGKIGLGEWVRVTQGTSELIFQVLAARNDPGNDTRLLFYADAQAVKTGSIANGAATITFSRFRLHADDVEGLQDTLNDVYARLDATNLTTIFKNAVRSPSDPYRFGQDYARQADGGATASAGQWALNAAPTLNGAAVQMSINFTTADLQSAVERWVVGNEVVIGTMRFRLAGAAVLSSGSQYIASVQWIAGANQTGSARPTLEADTPHRNEFAAVAFTGDYGDLANKPSGGGGLSDYTKVTLANAGNSNRYTLLTGLASTDVVVVTAYFTDLRAVSATIRISEMSSARILQNPNSGVHQIHLDLSAGSLRAYRTNEAGATAAVTAWKLG